MALLDSEIRRIRAELGINVLKVTAEPYISITQIFEQVVQANVTAGAITTCSTSVAEADTPTVVSLTLADATGFNAYDRVVVDVDSLQEYATVRSISGLTISILLALGHTGTYPVTVEGGESLIRAKLRKIIALEQQIDEMAPAGAVKKADDDVEFFSPREMRSILGPAFIAWEQREYERRELAELIGIEYPRGLARTAGATMSVYG